MKCNTLAWQTAAHGGAVLDIGCGTGHFLRTLRALDFWVFGVDVARQVIEGLRISAIVNTQITPS